MDASQDLEGVTGLSSTDSVNRSSEPTPRSAHGHTHYIEEIARLKGQLAEATEALQGADNVRTSASSDQLQKIIDELSIEKTNVRHLRVCTSPTKSIFSLRTFKVNYTPDSLKRRMLPPIFVTASSGARRSLRPCAKRLIVIQPFLTAFSRPVKCRRLPRGMTQSLARFVKRWPDLSEPSLVRISHFLMDR